MRVSVLTFLFVAVALIPGQPTLAQSPEMPEPLAIVVDADGKPMVQVSYISSTLIQVMFEIDGDPVLTNLNYQHGTFDNGWEVYFSEDNCVGDIYISVVDPTIPLVFLSQRAVVFRGPDGIDGTYRVFRSTSLTPSAVNPESKLRFSPAELGHCYDLSGTGDTKLPAEEVLPNPLAGFHGPTVANPERLLRVRGGTRLP